MARQSRQPQSAPPPKARYRGGRASTSNSADMTKSGPADAIASRAKSRIGRKEGDK